MKSHNCKNFTRKLVASPKKFLVRKQKLQFTQTKGSALNIKLDRIPEPPKNLFKIEVTAITLCQLILIISFTGLRGSWKMIGSWRCSGHQWITPLMLTAKGAGRRWCPRWVCLSWRFLRCFAPCTPWGRQFCSTVPLCFGISQRLKSWTKLTIYLFL